jgi:ATPase subunit of ABC transporter with duplicated ATPase domains
MSNVLFLFGFQNTNSFPSTPSQWAEPLVVAYDVGYRLFNWQNVESGAHSFAGKSSVIDQTKEVAAFEVVKRDGFCFDCVDLCIEEGSMNCILGPAEMSSHLLKILAKRLSPTEGTVHHASGTSLGYIDSGVIENLKRDLDSTRTTAFDFLVSMCTEKSQEELRAHLTSFGMSSISQTKTPLVCLSGGEIFRFVLALEMMSKPPLLFLDSPTSHLDVESVNALAHGLKQWNGTVIMVCHDACFMRSLDEVKCVVIIPEEGKVRRIINEEGIGSMDSYLNSFQTKK